MDDAYPSSPHTELKRDFDHHARAQDEDMQAGLPLFERYQFLSPRKSAPKSTVFDSY